MSIAKEGDLDKTPYSHWSLSGYPMPEDTPYTAFDSSVPSVVNKELLDEVAKAANGEFQAIRRYSRMLELAPNPELKAILKDIRRDEKKHFHRFSSIYSAWTGGRQVPLRKNRVPSSFDEGVIASIEAEQEDVKFYRRLSEQTRIPYIQRSFLDASYDEQRHANWFRYIETLNLPKSGE